MGVSTVRAGRCNFLNPWDLHCLAGVVTQRRKPADKDRAACPSAAAAPPGPCALSERCSALQTVSATPFGRSARLAIRICVRPWVGGTHWVDA